MYYQDFYTYFIALYFKAYFYSTIVALYTEEYYLTATSEH